MVVLIPFPVNILPCWLKRWLSVQCESVSLCWRLLSAGRYTSSPEQRLASHLQHCTTSGTQSSCGLEKIEQKKRTEINFPFTNLTVLHSFYTWTQSAAGNADLTLTPRCEVVRRGPGRSIAAGQHAPNIKDDLDPEELSWSSSHPKTKKKKMKTPGSQ